MDNASSAPGASLIPDGTAIITTAHLVILAVLAVLAVLAILYGARLKRKRVAAEKELESYNEEVAQDPGPEVRQGEPAEPTPPSPPPPPKAAAPADRPSDELVEAHPVPGTPADDAGDDPANGPVTQLKGLGPKLAAKLGEQGITTVGQIAALDDDEARALDTRLGPFAGRMARDRWIEQARFLAAGDRKGFEAVFGKL